MFNTQRLTNMWDRLTALEGLMGGNAPDIQPKPLEIQQQEEIAIIPEPVIVPEPEPVEPEECCICMDAELGGNSSVKLRCGHELCLECFIVMVRGASWETNCHLCRMPFSAPIPVPVINNRPLEPFWIDSEDEEIHIRRPIRPLPRRVNRDRGRMTNRTQRWIHAALGTQTLTVNAIRDLVNRQHNTTYLRPCYVRNIQRMVGNGVLRRNGRNISRS